MRASFSKLLTEIGVTNSPDFRYDPTSVAYKIDAYVKEREQAIRQEVVRQLLEDFDHYIVRDDVMAIANWSHAKSLIQAKFNIKKEL